MKALDFILNCLYNFVFIYPFIMAYVWMTGSLFFIFSRSSRHKHNEPPEIEGNPLAAILVPCHNEEDCIRETIENLSHIDYPNYEVIAIDDGSTDRTWKILDKLAMEYDFLRIIKLTSNQGKGTAMTMAAMATDSEYIVCIDADALLDAKAVKWMLWHLVNFPRVGAVTGNPKIRNRTSLLAKIQVGEFSSIVCMIKRAQRVFGKIYTVSGVVAAFKKKALMDIGFWSNDMVTEDIDVSWKLQMRYWDIRFESNALCWMLVPETVKGIFRQRIRWSQGGVEVFIKNFRAVFDWKQRRIWFIYFEYLLSLIWICGLSLTVILWIINQIVGLIPNLGPGYGPIEMPAPLVVKTLWPNWSGVLIASTCLVQLTLGIIIESVYDRKLLKMIPWIIWYPALFWIMNALATAVAIPKVIFSKKSKLAIWESPDRGFRKKEEQHD